MRSALNLREFVPVMNAGERDDVRPWDRCVRPRTGNPDPLSRPVLVWDALESCLRNQAHDTDQPAVLDEAGDDLFEARE